MSDPVNSSVGARAFALREYPFQELTGEIIAGCYEVHDVFGFGFLERVYRRALAIELEHRGIEIQREVPFNLRYRGADVGLCRADLIVASAVVVEVKTGLLLDPLALPQTLNYLKASGLSVGLLCYFGPSVKIRRVVNSPSVADESSGPPR